MILYIVITVLLLYVLSVENRDQNCDSLLRGKMSSNSYCIAFVDKIPTYEDNIIEQINKTILLLSRVEFTITWRRSFAISLISALLIFLFVNYTVPGGNLNFMHYIIIFTFVFLSVYVITAWTQYHYLRPATQIAKRTLTNAKTEIENLD